MLEWAGWGVEFCVPASDAERSAQPLLPGLLPNGLDSSELIERVDPASLLFEGLKRTGADEAVCCWPADDQRVAVSFREPSPLQLKQTQSCQAASPETLANPARKDHSNQKGIVEYMSTMESWKRDVPFRLAFEGVIARFAARLPRHLGGVPVSRPEDTHVVWPRTAVCFVLHCSVSVRHLNLTFVL